MIDDREVLPRLNKSKRKKLMAFLNRVDNVPEGEAVLMSAGGELPADNRKDDGRSIYLYVSAKGIYGGGLYLLIDSFRNGDEDFRQMSKKKTAVLELLGVSRTPVEPAEEKPRQKPGRKRRVLTDEEKALIDELHQQGIGIGKIATKLHTSNSRIMEYVKGKNAEKG
jgi:hypothetical protein